MKNARAPFPERRSFRLNRAAPFSAVAGRHPCNLELTPEIAAVQPTLRAALVAVMGSDVSFAVLGLTINSVVGFSTALCAVSSLPKG